MKPVQWPKILMAAFIYIMPILLISTVTATAQVLVEDLQLTSSNPTADARFGASISLDADTAVIGAFKDAGTGIAYVFIRNGVAWIQQAQIIASDAAADDNFAKSVALEGDTLIVGASGNDDNGIDSGCAYIFNRTGEVWTEQAKLIASDALAGDAFGNSVSLSGNTLIIGAYGKDNSRGCAYIYYFDGTTWIQQAKLLASDGELDDRFAYSVSLSGDTALVGAYRHDVTGIVNAGSAYAFIRNGDAWTQEQKLIANDTALSNEFGWSLAIYADTAIVGAVLNNNGADTRAGSAYVFIRESGQWTQQQKLSEPAPSMENRFGFSVALSGDTALIGTLWAESPRALDTGAAYLFKRNNNIWEHTLKIAASNGALNDYFGNSVTINANTAMVGALMHDTSDIVGSGSVYVYQLVFHTTDQNYDHIINLSELLRLIQFYNLGSFHCDPLGEDGFNPGSGDTTCTPHTSDYNPQDWIISFDELLRLIQLYNSLRYYSCPGTGEDSFCPGTP